MPGSRLVGQLAGLLAVVSWGSYMALARAGMNQGLHVADFILLRFGVAGLIMLPFLLYRIPALRALGLRRSLAFTLAVGPLFVLLGVGGYRFAPLAQGAVVQPVTVTVVVTLAAALFLGEILTRQRLAGVIIALLGVILVGFGAPGARAAAQGPTWIGDLLFIGAGLCFAAFTLLLRRWRTDPLLATGVVSVLSGLVVVPWFFMTDTPARMLALPIGTLFAQALIQGFMSGVLAVLAFAITVKHLGAGPAALFPAMVPVAAILIGIPLTHEVPAPAQTIGLLIATAGLLVAVIPWRRA